MSVGRIWMLGALMLAIGPQALADAKRAQLTAAELRHGGAQALVDNRAFVPPDGAAAALDPFQGTLRLSEVEMTTKPDKFKSRDVLGKDPKIFPSVDLSFFTEGGDLVPTTQDVIRVGSLGHGKSYWDIIVQPGRVWSEPGDGGWSRASFPFALMESLEGETHNGVAMFLYKGKKITGLQFQIVQQTAPYYVEDYFSAWGMAPAGLRALAQGAADEPRRRYRQDLADQIEIRPWADLASKVGADKLNGFDSDIASDEIVLDGLLVDRVFYLKSCPSAAGELAYCDRQRFGVWSMTKSLANAAALLHLAQKYGADVFDAKVADYVKQAGAHPGWDKVTFGDLLNMASGFGNGSAKTDPNDINDGYLVDYAPWYEARTVQAKVEKMLDTAPPHPWGPGKVARYRDQDMFLLGVAMQHFLQSKEGQKADLWTMLEKEVYAPIGIHHAPTNKTLETDGSAGQPLMAFGFYANIGDLVKIATLFQDGGRHVGVQILDKQKLADLLPGPSARGLATGDPIRPAYLKAFWQAHYQGKEGACSLWYPLMSGWGGNIVALLPDGLIPVRLAKNWNGGAAASELASLAEVADRIRPFCR